MSDDFPLQTKMIFEYLRKGIILEDTFFNTMYPTEIRPLAETHFTHIHIAKMATEFLVQKTGTKVLDIGSGAGKFCMIGASLSDGFFTGVELRKKFYDLSQRLLKKYKISNAQFIQANITSIDFQDYDAFYLFNPFYENILKYEKMDDSLELENELYDIYSNYVKEQLDKMPVGTRVATYFSAYDEIPDSYKKQFNDDQEKITFWEKTV